MTHTDHLSRTRALLDRTLDLAAAGAGAAAYVVAAEACVAADGLSWPMRAAVLDVALAARELPASRDRLAAAAELAGAALEGRCV